jgi:hypothetical protein
VQVIETDGHLAFYLERELSPGDAATDDAAGATE